MTGVERLRDAARLEGIGHSWNADVLRGKLCDIADQIEREQAKDHKIAESVRKNGPVGADCLPIRNGDEVWAVRDGNGPFKVVSIDLCAEFPITLTRGDGGILMAQCTPDELTHTKPVIGADGLPIKKGETVWHKDGRGPWTVEVVHADTDQVTCLEKINVSGTYPPLMLTHTKPEQPTPKVLDADGAEIRVGDDVYSIEDGTKYKVCEAGIPRVTVEYWCAGIAAHSSIAPNLLTHSAPVIATDGKPLSGGETVWGVNGATYRVTDVHDGKVFARHIGGSFGAEVEFAGGSGLYRLRAEQLTHERPDSWEQLEKDATVSPETYCVRRGIDIADVDSSHIVLDDVTERMARDLVRRAKALAARERGER